MLPSYITSQPRPAVGSIGWRKGRLKKNDALRNKFTIK
jgi:hypothetical protein